MTKGSWVHDDVSRHFASCPQCRTADPENRRHKHDKLGQVAEQDVPADAIAAMCSNGRAIYRMYLRWLAEPAE